MGFESSTEQESFGFNLMASTLAHEIRNPLQTIKLQLEIAKRGGPANQALQKIAENVQRLENVVAKVQKLGHQHDIDFKSVSLRDLVRECLSSLSFWLEATQIQVSVQEHWEGEPFCFGDADLLQQVLLNLVMNAVQAMPAGGKLKVNILESARDAWIEVIDTGHGISKEDLKVVGTPFFTTKAEGNGLGLAFCKTVINRHKGEFAVESIVGQGTQISVRLPKTQRTSSEENYVS